MSDPTSDGPATRRGYGPPVPLPADGRIPLLPPPAGLTFKDKEDLLGALGWGPATSLVAAVEAIKARAAASAHCFCGGVDGKHDADAHADMSGFAVPTHKVALSCSCGTSWDTAAPAVCPRDERANPLR